MSFYAKKTPSILFSSAMHTDYHTTGDTADKISGEKFEQVTRLVYLIACDLANREDRIIWKNE